MDNTKAVQLTYDEVQAVMHYHARMISNGDLIGADENTAASFNRFS